MQTVTHQWVSANVGRVGRNAIRAGYRWNIRISGVWYRVWLKDRGWYVIEREDAATSVILDCIDPSPISK